MLLTMYLLVVSISQNGCYPQFLGVDVSPHKVVAWGRVDHGLQLTANTVRLQTAKVSVNDSDSDITKKISRLPIYHTKWKRRVLYNNTKNTHSLTHPHTHTLTHSHTHTHPHTHSCTHTHSLTHPPTHTYTHTRTHTHTHAHKHISWGIGMVVKKTV